MKTLESLLKRYVDKYGYDLDAIRKEYCGAHCGPADLIEFKAIWNEEMNRIGG